jgi:small subunit ribosomal protein S7
MRTKKHKPRKIDPDEKYDSVLVAKLINRSMRDGKKAVARKHVYSALEEVSKKMDQEPDDIMKQIVDRVAPKKEVRSRRVGGASYQVPMPVKPRRATSLAIRWIVVEANQRPNREYQSYAKKLAAEIMDALNDKGGSIDRRNQAHRMAEANKAFAHFRW